ncbi:hypothetical protein M9H77_06499 [Catharanthus roseus]|uniref:Uncharacterized protein n=1 Tax=Catharanthus roseus TaxID=4058 RepID=A0ACC0BSG3_CATRO|nr:hypothetical protein M9H77_06499 [Catharanthus roseus]
MPRVILPSFLCSSNLTIYRTSIRELMVRNKNESRRQKAETFRAWQGHLPSMVGAKDGRVSVTRDLPQLVGLTQYFSNSIDYSQGYLELKKEEQSRATDWGLIGAID